MPSGLQAGLARHGATLDWIADPLPHDPAPRPADRGAEIHWVRGWCETPAEAPMPMEARAFEPILPREVLRAALRWAPALAASAFGKIASGAGSRA